MFEKFGEFDSFSEINELAENLFNEGDTTSLKEMAAENGIPEKAEKKKKDADKPKAKQKGRSKKVCPNCGRKMKQQFIGLQHCKCGMSWKKDIGYFERTGDMVFALERRKAGKKTKQCPVIRYR